MAGPLSRKKRPLLRNGRSSSSKTAPFRPFSGQRRDERVHPFAAIATNRRACRESRPRSSGCERGPDVSQPYRVTGAYTGSADAPDQLMDALGALHVRDRHAAPSPGVRMAGGTMHLAPPGRSGI